MRSSESRSLGSFNPLILQLKLSAEVPSGIASEELIGTFFHEHVHFWQSIATTYGISRHFEMLDWIAKAVREMGGHHDMVLHGLAKPIKTSFLTHLKEHRNMDGGYSSAPRRVATTSPAEGWLELNESTCCWEYIRLNPRDKHFFATPIGAHTIQENLAHIMEQIGISTKGHTALRVRANAPSKSQLHDYYVATECFWNMFPGHREQPESFIATLIAMLEACLQIPSMQHQRHPEWAPMTHPSTRFRLLFDEMEELHWIDHEDNDDYLRFVEEIFGLLGWPAPQTVLREHLEWLDGVLSKYENQASEHRRQQPDRFEEYVQNRLTATKRRMLELYSGTTAASIIDDRLKEFEAAVRGSSTAYLGIFGMGLLEYIVRSLRMRVREPLWFVFMHLHSDQLIDELPLPIQFYKDVETNQLTAKSMALFNDLRAFPHLWAITLQWAHKRKDLQCGNRYFEVPCIEPRCKQGLCPDWTPGKVHNYVDCTFVSVLQHFGLWKEGETNEPQN